MQFYRQKPIGNSIADFYAPAAKLVLELDGAQHLEIRQAKYDAQRTIDLEKQGLKVLRFDGRQVLLQTEPVLETISQAMKKTLLTSLCEREEPSVGEQSAEKVSMRLSRNQDPSRGVGEVFLIKDPSTDL